MADYNPIAEAKNFRQQYVAGGRFTDEEYETGVGWLVDYIDALTAALRDAQQYVDKVADEWDHEPAEVLAHTIRHLLDD